MYKIKGIGLLWAYKEETKKLANCTYHCIIGAVRQTAPIIILSIKLPRFISPRALLYRHAY